jgi:rod shape determining protein RodA
MVRRRPDSGLGNIHRQGSAPSRNIDWVLMAAVGALTAIGLLVIFSASHSKSPIGGLHSYGYYFVTRQQAFLVVGVVVMALVMGREYDWFNDRSRIGYSAALMMLALVVLLGKVSNGANLSFNIGAFNIQPAEYAKFAVLLQMANFLANDKRDVLHKDRFIRGLLVVGAPVVLIIAQPDLGSASVLVVMAVGMMLVAGARFRDILRITLLSVVTVGVAVVTGFVNTYQLKRFSAFFNQNSRDPDLAKYLYQGRNALRAVATGGITGKGWLQGPITNAPKDIPVQWADFPFSAVGEQFGLLGAAVLLALYGVVLFRIWRAASLARDTLGTYLCVGVFSMVLWQVFQNVAMTIGLMPITGLPLPFVSYGGSGLLTFYALIGLVQNVHMRRRL